MSQPTLTTYGGLLHDTGYAGQLVDQNPRAVISMANYLAQPILFGQAVARGNTDDNCKAPVTDADVLIGISRRFPIRPTSGPSVGGTNVVQYSQWDEVPVIREGWVYVFAAENVTRGDKVVSLTAGHGTLGSEANNQGTLGTVTVTLPGVHAASGTVNIHTNPANNDTVTIFGTAVTFKTSANPSNMEVTIGLNQAATCTALYAKVSASGDANLIKGTYADDGVGTMTCTSVATNTAANALTLATSVLAKVYLNGVSQASSTLSGGEGNVGNGVLTPDVTTPVLTGGQTGIYHAECIAAAGGGGTFRVYDPSGNEIAPDFAVAATFQTQIKFVIAAGNVDFVVGDEINVKVNPLGATGRVSMNATWETTTLQGAIGKIHVHS